MIPRLTCLLGATLLLALPVSAADKEPAGISVDKKARTVSIDCKVAPRKLPTLDKIYPIEVIACYPAPKGQKAHETVVTFTVKPSDVHKALESLGLKAGAPGFGKGAAPKGPEVSLFIDVPVDGGKTKRVSLDDLLVNKMTGKPLPKLKWLFTGSIMSTPDPEKDDKVYGADITGTLITLYSVTNETVLQSSLGFDLESTLKVEVATMGTTTSPTILPKVGTPVKLVIQAK